MSAPNVFVIFCDDVRQEVGNKASYMGFYNNEIVFAEAAPVLPKLVVNAFVQWLQHRPPTGWDIQFTLPKGNRITPVRLPPEGTPLVADQNTGLVTINLQVSAIPFPLEDGTRLTVELVRKRKRKLVACLRIKRATATEVVPVQPQVSQDLPKDRS